MTGKCLYRFLLQFKGTFCNTKLPYLSNGARYKKFVLKNCSNGNSETINTAKVKPEFPVEAHLSLQT